MAKTVIKLRNVRALLRSDEVWDDLEGRANRIAEQAGEGMVADVQRGANRVRASVRTDTVRAMLNEMYYRDLTAAIDAGR